MNAKKRICLVAGSAPTYRQEIYSLMGREFHCDFVLGAGNTKQMNIKELPNNVYQIKTRKLWGLPLFWQAGAIKHIKQYDTLILCMSICSITEWLILFIALFRRQETFCWTHGFYGKEDYLKSVVKRIYFSLFTGILVYGERARHLMINIGINPQKIFVVHNSLSYSKQLPIRLNMNTCDIYRKFFSNEYPTIIFVGRLTKVKQLDLIVEAQKILRGNDFCLNVVFVGDGTERQTLQSLVKEYHLDPFVWFYGACYDEETNADLIYNADLCVSPGNVGLTAVHVMMFGCPVITNDDFNHQMPEFEAIKRGITGDFFHQNSVNSLANSIRQWLTTHMDNREEIRQACYEEIDNKWNPHIQIDILRKVLYHNS